MIRPPCLSDHLVSARDPRVDWFPFRNVTFGHEDELRLLQLDQRSQLTRALTQPSDIRVDALVSAVTLIKGEWDVCVLFVGFASLARHAAVTD